MYTIEQVSKLTGLTKRAIRFYEEMHLLVPIRNESNYRYYSSKDLDILQEILFLQSFDFDLKTIQKWMKEPESIRFSLLKEQLGYLYEKRKQLDILIDNLKTTLQKKEDHTTMKDKDKFKGFKHNLIKENDQKYKTEVISRYGEKAYETSKKQFMNMTESDYQKFVQFEKDMFKALELANNSSGIERKEHLLDAAKNHQAWIRMAWGTYNLEMHVNLVKMYQEDLRFKKYYDDVNPNFASLLLEAVLLLTE